MQERLAEIHIYPASHYVTPAEQLERALGDGAGGAGRAAGLPARAQPAAGGPAAGAAHALRHGDAARARLLPRHRELLAPPHRPAAGRGAAGAHRVPAEGRADHHRREPRGGAPGPRHVLRRPLAQGVARRVWLPAAVGLRQPAADLRGVHAASTPPDGVRVGHAERLRAGAGRRRGGRAGDPAHRAHGPQDHRAAGRRPGRRPPRTRSAPAPSARSACSSPR